MGIFLALAIFSLAAGTQERTSAVWQLSFVYCGCTVSLIVLIDWLLAGGSSAESTLEEIDGLSIKDAE